MENKWHTVVLIDRVNDRHPGPWSRQCCAQVSMFVTPLNFARKCADSARMSVIGAPNIPRAPCAQLVGAVRADTRPLVICVLLALPSPLVLSQQLPHPKLQCVHHCMVVHTLQHSAKLAAGKVGASGW